MVVMPGCAASHVLHGIGGAHREDIETVEDPLEQSLTHSTIQGF
jgi:hypothetical protein